MLFKESDMSLILRVLEYYAYALREYLDANNNKPHMIIFGEELHSTLKEVEQLIDINKGEPIDTITTCFPTYKKALWFAKEELRELMPGRVSPLTPVLVSEIAALERLHYIFSDGCKWEGLQNDL